MDRFWFYTQGGSTDKKGPVSEAEIRALMVSGELQPTDLLWTEGMANWAALSTLPDLSRPAASAAPKPVLSAVVQTSTAGGGLGVPPGLQGWMTFIGVMNIIAGVFYIVTCFGMVVGIPMLMAGMALLAAKNALDGATIDPSLDLFFAKLKSFMTISGWVYIIGFIFFIISIIIQVVFVGAGLSNLNPMPH